MKVKKLLALSTFLFSSLLNTQFAKAEEATVYCADENQNWKWLDNGNVKVHGEWKIGTVYSFFNFHYFILEDALITFMILQHRCKQEIGEKYIYVQPSKKGSRVWAPFAIVKNQLLGGHISYLRNF